MKFESLVNDFNYGKGAILSPHEEDGYFRAEVAAHTGAGTIVEKGAFLYVRPKNELIAELEAGKLTPISQSIVREFGAKNGLNLRLEPGAVGVLFDRKTDDGRLLGARQVKGDFAEKPRYRKVK